MDAPIVTLATDFGPGSSYAGLMKGVILSIAPQAHVVDLDHTIEPQNVLGAAFLMEQALRFFPPGAIHVAVVDPGVGSGRKILAAATDQAIFIAPDNGLLSIVLERNPDARVYEVTNTGLFLDPISDTFHGRDIFAPVAAHLANGLSIGKLGPALDDPFTISWRTTHDEAGGVRGAVVRIDRFGNLITSIPEAELHGVQQAKPGVLGSVAVGIGGRQIDTFVTTYSDAGPGEMVFYVGSGGYVEIAEPLGRAADRLQAGIGDEVVCW